MKKNWRTRFLTSTFHKYIWLVEKTSRLEVVEEGNLNTGVLAGYWHGDSVATMLLMRRLYHIHGVRAACIVTADPWGDVIEGLLEPHGCRMLRVPDGMAAKARLKEIYAAAEDNTHLFAACLDGPTGPYRKQKQLAGRLAQRTGRVLFIVEYEYTRAIHLKRRWDRYTIPLPFSLVRARTVLPPYVRQPEAATPQLYPACSAGFAMSNLGKI